MSSLMFSLFLVIVFVAIAIAVRDEPVALISFSLLAFTVLVTLVVIVAPDVLGVGRAPDSAEEFTRRLEVGVVYKVDAIIKPENATDDEKIIIVHSSLKNYRAIYVKVSEPIPTQFTLINGLPREVK